MGGGGETRSSHDLREGSSASPNIDDYQNALASTAWITPLIVAANVIAFVAMAVIFNSVRGFNPDQLAISGANSGMLDLSGQWWRLLTYQFLHANLFHIAINMWVMWSVGRFTERLCGSFTLLFVYLMGGALASLVSIAWNPYQVTWALPDRFSRSSECS